MYGSGSTSYANHWAGFYIFQNNTQRHTRRKKGEKNAQEENDHVTVWMAPPCFCKVDVKIGEFHLHLRHVESAARFT